MRGVEFSVFVRQLDDGLADFVRFGNIEKSKSLLFTGCLNIDIAVIKHGGKKAVAFRSYILHAEQIQFSDSAGKQTSLVDINYAVVRDNPDIQKIIDKSGVKKQPDGKGVHAAQKNQNRQGDVIDKKRGE